MTRAIEDGQTLIYSALRTILFALPLLFLALFYFYPLAQILRLSFMGQDGVGQGAVVLKSIRTLLAQPFLWRVLWFTTWQAAASTLLTLLLGMPLAFLFARYTFPGKALIRALTTIPFVMPTVVVAAAFTTVAGENGILNDWLQAIFGLDIPSLQITRGIWGILLAHAFYNVSIVVRTVGGFWSLLNPRLDEAATMLGASPRQIFREITVPLLLPSILAAGMLVFLFCFTSFGVVLILGGLRYATIEVEIYRQAVSLFNLPAAAILSLLQIVLTFGLMMFYTRLQKRSSVVIEMRPLQNVSRPMATLRARIFGLPILGFSLLFLVGPLLALAWRSITLGGNGITLTYYTELAVNRRQSAFFVPPLIGIRNSLLFALATMAISLILGILSAYLLARSSARESVAAGSASIGLAATIKAKVVGYFYTLLDPLFLLPLGTSAVTLGFGYIVSMGSWRTSVWIVPVAHSLIAAPFVVRTLLPALRGMDEHLRESAALLGAHPLRVWLEVDLPLLYRAALVGAIFAFTISLGEFGATLLISRPDMPTIPIVIYQKLGQPGLLNYGQALAMSTILMLVTALSLLGIERFRIQGTGEF